MAGGSLYHITHAINQTHLRLHIVPQNHLSRLFRDKFRFCGSDSLPSGTLGHFVLCTYLLRGIFHIGQNQLIHKSFDKSGFPGAHGTYHTYVDFTVCPLSDIVI